MCPVVARSGTSDARVAHASDTLISIVIAFVVAFIFRGFVFEAFVIPTGSMAPTLLGAHVRVRGPETGYTWAVGPWFYARGRMDAPLAVQGTPGRPIVVHDPMSREQLALAGLPRRAGDRIMVFKYLPLLHEPRRFDPAVFRAPHEPGAATNYIKRIVGLPGEEIALVDGDVFVRPAPADAPGGDADRPGTPGSTWQEVGWTIARKDERTQRAVWQDVFDSRFVPLKALRGAEEFIGPWRGGNGWDLVGRMSYRYRGSGPTVLRWDAYRWPILDTCSYNEVAPESRPTLAYPVSDVAVEFALEPESGEVPLAVVVRTRGHEFRAEVAGRRATLRMGALGPIGAEGVPAPPAEWTVLSEGLLPQPLGAGRPARVEVWHVDQAVWLFVDGTRIARGAYDWTPAQRVEQSVLMTLPEILRTDAEGGNTLAQPGHYVRPEIAIELGSGPATLHRVRVRRDIYYQPARPGRLQARPRACHPAEPMFLGPRQFFVCGDNSAASQDSRLWGDSDPWVAATLDPTPGIVRRELLVGRAFFVYLPATVRGPFSPLPMIDFGRLRWIW